MHGQHNFEKKKKIQCKTSIVKVKSQSAKSKYYSQLKKI